MKAKNKIPIPALLILLAMCLTVCAPACAKSEDQKTDTPTAEKAADDTEAGEDSAADAGPIEYKAQAEPFDWGGKEFRILVNPNNADEWRDVDFTAEEQNGEPINDAVYLRSLTVEDMFNISIIPVNTDYGAHVGNIRKTVNAGENAYDLAFNSTFDSASLAQEGVLYDLYSVPNIDLAQPWWDQNAVSDLSIMGKLYYMTGDIGTMYKKSVAIILFNKQMMQDYALGNPYQFVEENKWTMDKFLEMCTAVSQDLNSDGKWDDKDKYGLLGYCDIIAVSLIGGGVKFAEKNGDDIPEITFMNEKTVAIFEKITGLLYKPELFWSWSKAGSNNERSRVMFANNQGLFNWNEFHSIPNLREMETDFGILPMPLYDESQDRYYHSVNPHVAQMMAIPASNPDPENTGAVISHLGAIGKNMLTPAYYDISLKGKHARDEESIMTMDLIFSTITYDPGYMNNWGGLAQFTLNMVDAYKTDLVSQYEKLESKAFAALEKMTDKYASLE
ncbi:MAG: extracellular solute-binding protein [Oscillospiraceae bacterium]|nr:extracellular solute-binding protein [Oscillospiraceae bacterium]